jgi:hypothetical protein
MKGKPPTIRAFRKTCDEVAHDVYNKLQCMIPLLTKEEVNEGVHRVLRGEDLQSLTDFSIEELVQDEQRRYPSIVCSHKAEPDIG